MQLEVNVRVHNTVKSVGSSNLKPWALALETIVGIELHSERWPRLEVSCLVQLNAKEVIWQGLRRGAEQTKQQSNRTIDEGQPIRKARGSSANEITCTC